MDTLKILVVDDESRMRKLVKDFLTKKNFQVLEAGDGEEAMDVFYNFVSRIRSCSILFHYTTILHEFLQNLTWNLYKIIIFL